MPGPFETEQNMFNTLGARADAEIIRLTQTISELTTELEAAPTAAEVEVLEAARDAAVASLAVATAERDAVSTELAQARTDLTAARIAVDTVTRDRDRLAALLPGERVYPGFTKRIFEDFNTSVAPGLVYDDPYYKTVVAGYGDSNPYRKSNAEVKDGSLILSAPGGTAAAPSTGAIAVLGGWAWTYGAAEVRYRAEGGAGTGLAGMLWPNDGWRYGEVDVIEAWFNAAGTATAQTFVHPTPCAERQSEATTANPYCGNNSSSANTGKTFADWHTSRVEWTPDALKFYMDGVLYHTNTKAVGTATAKRRLTWQIADPQKGGVCAPGKVFIDYFRIDSYTP